MFDILITVAQKDFNKLPFVLKSIVQNIRGFNQIHIVSNSIVPSEAIVTDVYLHLDGEVLDYDFSKILMQNRIGWYRQQFIKLFQEVTCDNYVVIDADAYINHPIIIDSASPVFYLGREQHHKPYFECFKLICELDRIYPHSFISELMHFKRGVIQFLLSEMNMTKTEFIDRCVQCINKINHPSSFSEYEFYGNYVTKNWKDFYRYVNLNVLSQHKQRLWSDSELRDTVNKYSKSNYDILTMHSWL